MGEQVNNINSAKDKIINHALAAGLFFFFPNNYLVIVAIAQVRPN